MKPTVSVIIPAYNIEAYLPECLTSLAGQTFRDFECLVVDDGSTDATGRIAMDFAEKDSRFVCLRQENSGQAAARNRAMAAARGTFFAFVDGDDRVDATYLETLMGLMNEDTDMAVCGAVRLFEDGTVRKNAATVTGDESITDMHAYLMRMGFSVWSKLFRRSLFDGLVFPEGIKFEDFALLPQAVLRCRRVATSAKVLYYYRWRPGSTLTARRVNRDILRAYAVLEHSRVQETYPDVVDAYFVKIVMGSLLWEMLLQSPDNLEEAGRIMREGLRNHPGIASQPLGPLMGREKVLYGRCLIAGRLGAARRAALAVDRVKQVRRALLYGANKIKRVGSSKA